MQFSNIDNTGIVEQTRAFMRVDATQWPTVKIANSCNNWHDYLISYGIANDKFLQLDDTNHTFLNEAYSDLTINVTDYSFLVDQQGNQITTLLGVSRLDNSKYIPLTPVDRSQVDLSTFAQESGIPTQYDKISDNIIRLNYKPRATVADGLKYFFQRAGSHFTDADTTKQPGVNIALHRGYVIASAYDGALALGLDNLQALSVEREREVQKLIEYFNTRNNDQPKRMTAMYQNNR